NRTCNGDKKANTTYIMTATTLDPRTARARARARAGALSSNEAPNDSVSTALVSVGAACCPTCWGSASRSTDSGSLCSGNRADMGPPFKHVVGSAYVGEDRQ